MTRDEYLSRAHEFAPRGERLPQTKLTPDDVAMIRELHEWKQREIERINSIASHKALAEKFGVHENTIYKALSRQSHAA